MNTDESSLRVIINFGGVSLTESVAYIKYPYFL